MSVKNGNRHTVYCVEGVKCTSSLSKSLIHDKLMLMKNYA